MKRLSFLLLSFISLLIIISTFILIVNFGSGVIRFLEIFFLYFVVISMILLFNLMISDHNSIVTPMDVITTLKLKKVYFDDIDDEIFIYISKNNSMSSELVRISIWKQNFSHMKRIGYTYAKMNDIDDIKNKIRSELKSLYDKEISEKKLKENIKNWDGSVDLKTERNRKLNNLLKK